MKSKNARKYATEYFKVKNKQWDQIGTRLVLVTNYLSQVA